MNNYFSTEEVDFLHNHIDLIRPAMIDGKLPSCIHMENFRKNPRKGENDKWQKEHTH